MRTFRPYEQAFVADLAELCSKYGVTLQFNQPGIYEFVGPHVEIRIDEEFRGDLNDKRSDVEYERRTQATVARGATDKAILAALATLAMYGFDLSIGADDDQMRVNVPDESLSTVKGYLGLLPDPRRSRAAIHLNPGTLTVTKADGTVE